MLIWMSASFPAYQKSLLCSLMEDITHLSLLTVSLLHTNIGLDWTLMLPGNGKMEVNELFKLYSMLLRRRNEQNLCIQYL